MIQIPNSIKYSEKYLFSTGSTVGSKYPVPLEVEHNVRLLHFSLGFRHFSLGLTHGNWGNWYVVPFKTVPTVHELKICLFHWALSTWRNLVQSLDYT